MGLIGPDEPRYVWIARAMASTGDWVTPRLYGQPWFEKPILYYWLGALGFLLRLPAEWAARLPSAIAAMIAALAIGWLGWAFYRSEDSFETSPALLAPLVFCTTVAAIGFARAATPDMLFTTGIALSMASAAQVLRSSGALGTVSALTNAPKRHHIALALFGAFLGFAVLAKGPAAVVLAAGAIGLWALATKRWRIALRLAHPLAIITFCVVALPWYLLCALKNPEFLRVFILQHNFERYLTPVFQHKQPFWFFLPITLIAILPWVAPLWPLFERGVTMRRGRAWDRSPSFFLACWAFFPVLFFSFSESKLPSYILPAIPALSLLLAIALTKTITAEPKKGQIAKQLGLAMATTWFMLGLGAVLWLKHAPIQMREDLQTPISITAGIAVAGGIGIAIDGLFRKRVSVLLMVLTAVLCVEAAGRELLPALDPYVSARSHARLLENDAHPDRIFTYELPRAWTYGLAFYLGRELPEWNPKDPEATLVLTTPKGHEAMEKMGRVSGELEETYKGILFVPAFPAPRQ